jgi:RNA polymerase sigma-70 factor (ECF subfamily)
MQAIAEGDGTACAELVHRHRGWVCNLLYAFTHNKDQAEDLTQEVFCRMVQHAGNYVAQGHFRAWLKRIAVNLGRNYLARLRLSTVSLSECEDVVTDNGWTDPMALLMDEVVHVKIREAIQSLPDPKKRALVMRYFSGMTVQQIAEVLQCPEGTVKSRIFHGLRHIRQRIAVDEAYGGEAS